MGTILQDIRYALRQLRRSPGFSATVILTMALGIGANAVVFGVLNALLLRPLNLPHASELVSINDLAGGQSSPSQSYPNYRDLRDRNSTFSSLAAVRIDRVGVAYGNTTLKSWFYQTSDNYFDLLQIKPYLGRFFTAADAHGTNSMPYAVLGYDFWRTQMNADPSIVGKVVQLNKQPFTVLGIAPPGFFGTEIFFHASLWVPMLNESQLEGFNFLDSRSSGVIWMLGRLKPGISETAATANLNNLAGQLASQYKEDDGLRFSLSKPGLIGDVLGGPVHAFLAAVMALAALVLLAASANLASLFSARAGDRAREFALRVALGSSRRRLLRQLIVESILMCLLGGAFGLTLGQFLLRILSQWHPPGEFPIQVDVHGDASVTLLALALSLACGLFFGLVPALAVWKHNAYQVIKQGNTGAVRGRRLTFRDLLLLLQVVFCAVLVTSSLVAVRGLVRSLHASFGFQPQNVTLATFDLKMAGYTDQQAFQFQRRAAEAAAQLPGVAAVGFANTTPLALDSSTTSVWREGTTDKRPATRAASAKYYDVSPGYLAAAQTRLLTGRDFTWHDDAQSPHVAIVNETFARQVFGTTNAVGRTFLIRNDAEEVIGVVEDGKYENLTEDPTAAIFFASAQSPDTNVNLVVRALPTAASSQLGAALQHRLKQLDPSIPVTLNTWQQTLSLVLLPSIAATVALGTMGALAAMLALTGIFGMASYAVSRRLHEFGIRMALGAARRQLLASAIGRPARILAIGSLLGLAAGALANKLLAAIVYQATSRDPLVLFGVVLSMALIGLLAAWFPARRALSIEPSRLLRED